LPANSPKLTQGKSAEVSKPVTVTQIGKVKMAKLIWEKVKLNQPFAEKDE